MALQFQVPSAVVDYVMGQLKESQLVHPQAAFNHQADLHRRCEVAYRDVDFLDRIGRTPLEEAVIDGALAFLKANKLVTSDAFYDREAFEALRKDVKAKFTDKAGTSFSPTMERLFYMLTSVRRPDRLIEFGCFWGNTLAWFAGPCLGPRPTYQAGAIYGIDIDAPMLAKARANFAKLENTQSLHLLDEDGRDTLKRLDGPFDMVYLEAKKSHEENIYLELLKAMYHKLPKGAWILAHDSTRWTFRQEMEEYLAFVRDSANFSQSVSFDVDAFGVELTIK